MSLPLEKVICSGCDYEVPEYHRPLLIKFRMSHGIEAEVKRAKGWCDSCGGYVDIALLDRKQLKSEVVGLLEELCNLICKKCELERGPFLKLMGLARTRRVKREIDNVNIRLVKLHGLLRVSQRWASAGRCLSCGSGRITPLQYDSNTRCFRGFRHSCGGHLGLIEDPSGMRYSFNLTNVIINRSGDITVG
jgi:hypothetical protein